MNEWFALLSGFMLGLCAVLPLLVLVLRPFPLVPGRPPEPEQCENGVRQLPRSTKSHNYRVVVFDPDGKPVLGMD